MKPAAPSLPAARLYHGEVSSVDAITADTRILGITLAGGQRLDYLAGQYALLQAEGFEPREFSIASAPHHDELEFHIKSTGRGISNHIFENWHEGTKVQLQAPFGAHYWRPSKRPLLALAGGVGIAPMKAIIGAHFEHSPHAPATLYWGVRDEDHLYLDSTFITMNDRNPDFTYIPLIAGKGEDFRRKGFIGPAVAEDFPDLSRHIIYMAGPAAMVQATLPILLEQGAQKDFIFSDAFGG
ncbi:MAG: FAD-binding oxidoreductase [Alphaproteobacteria bacterium]